MKEIISKVVLENNKRLNKEIEKMPVRDNLGNVKYETVYTKEIWTVERNVSKSGKTNITLIYPLRSSHGKGGLTTIELRLSKLEIEYITNKAGALYDGSKLKLKTRFMYGFRNDGSMYLYVGVLIGNKYLNYQFLNDMQVDIIMDNFLKLETAYDIHLELKDPNENVDVLDMTNNVSESVVDID